ncbi:adenosylcobinamide-phosphate synthase CbiB [Geomonas sp. RF6]|uniref:adenosylcobinamide-phosphate synthase CbiB n=1 Tax=Geomonas sp. RF6 TaxID=2897342 RepID=UPI001E34B80B|nr:adenosylcobinamide-phosphate synthase CbiB [Geomonas sp. RF6]UFS71799.1 adenosylcobinamide-phosphate synthase CbiB [Geomonas sp. RF6]
MNNPLPLDATLLLCAVIIDLLLGDPRSLPHPVAGIGRFISGFERFLRQRVANQKTGGIILLVATVTLTYLAADCIIKGAYAVSRYLGYVVEIYLAWTCLAARSLHQESAKVTRAIESGDLGAARHWLSYIVGRETAQLDEGEVLRATVETVAENTGDGVIAPLFYLMLGGAPLALAYKAVNTLDSMVGYKNERYLHFGWASARFDDLANYIPARLTGFLMVASAHLCSLDGSGAKEILLRDCHSHSSPNSGFPEAAAAGALRVQLGGTNTYFGKVMEKPTIGEALVPLTPAAYHGAVKLMYCSEGVMVGSYLIFKVMLGF